jgi:chaperonin cofactor prefoldin
MEATDERMDDLNHRVDEGFERVDDRFERIETRFDRVDDRFERIETRFDATQRLIIQVGGGMIATMMVGFLSVIAIQL